MKPKYWNIQESRVKNQFTIATTDTEVFWGLTDDQPHTPVDLAEIASDSRQWWMFHPNSNSVTAASAIPPQASLLTATIDSARKKASMLSSRPPEVKPQTQPVQSAGDIQKLSDGISERANVQVVSVCNDIRMIVGDMKREGRSEDDLVRAVSPLLGDMVIHLSQMEGDVKWDQS